MRALRLPSATRNPPCVAAQSTRYDVALGELEVLRHHFVSGHEGPLCHKVDRRVKLLQNARKHLLTRPPAIVHCRLHAGDLENGPTMELIARKGSDNTRLHTLIQTEIQTEIHTDLYKYSYRDPYRPNR